MNAGSDSFHLVDSGLQKALTLFLHIGKKSLLNI
jgi:hypothetical protein